MDFRRSGLENEGFEGFVPIHHLKANDCACVPDQMGVYVVFRTPATPPAFLAESVGGYYKGENPTVSAARLRAEWVPDVEVVYIGKAGAAGSDVTLKDRVGAYMRFGRGRPVAHRGGKLIWQLADHDDLLVCWKELSSQDPRSVEKYLIAEFARQYGPRPFANLQG